MRLKLLVALLLVSLPAAAQMRSAKKFFDTPRSRQAALPGCTGATEGWLPVGNSSTAAQCFWAQDGSAVLKQAEMLTTGGSTAATTEAYSDFVGGIRIAFSSAVASGSSDSDDTTVSEDEQTTHTNLLLANGGNVALSAAYPLFVRPYAAGELVAVTYARLGGTFDMLTNTGSSSQSIDWNELNANAEWAVTAESSLRTAAGVFNFEVHTNAGVITGTKLFRTSIGTDHGVVLHGEIGGSVQLGSTATVGVSFNWFSDDAIPNGASVLVGIGR